MATFYRNDLWAHYSNNSTSLYLPIIYWKDETPYIEYDGVIRNYKDTNLLEQIGVFIALIPESVLPICAKAFSDENKWERVDYLGYGDLFSKIEDLPTESIADFLDKRRQTPTDGRERTAKRRD